MMALPWAAILAWCGALSLASATSSPPEPSPCATVSHSLARFTAAPTPSISVTEAPVLVRQDGVPGCTTTSVWVPATATCWSTGTTFACSMGSSLSKTCCLNGCTFSPTTGLDIESGGHDGLPATVTSIASFDGSVSIPDSPKGSATANWTLTLDQKLEREIADIVNGYCSDHGLFTPDRRDTSGLTLPGFVGCEVGDLKPTVESELSNEIALFLYDKLEIPVLAVSEYAQNGMLAWNFRRTVASVCTVAILSGLYSVRLIQETYEISPPLINNQVGNEITMPSMTADYGEVATATSSSKSNMCPACNGDSCPTLSPDEYQGEDGPLPYLYHGVVIGYDPNVPIATTAPPRSGRICTAYANPTIYECAGCSCSSGTHTGLYSFSEFIYATNGIDGKMTTSTDICYGHSTYPAASLTTPCTPTSTPPFPVTWAPDYCTHITSKKGDQRGNGGYCNCPGDMPYYPSTRDTTQTTSGWTVTTSRVCGYTSLPPIESLINTTATTKAGPTYIGGNLPVPVTVSSPYCAPTDSSVPGFAGNRVKEDIDFACKIFMKRDKVTFYPGGSPNETAMVFDTRRYSRPGKHKMIILAQYFEDACESNDNHNITFGKDITYDKCMDIMTSISKDCGYFHSYPWAITQWYVGGGYYANCMYFQLLPADYVNTTGWKSPVDGFGG